MFQTTGRDQDESYTDLHARIQVPDLQLLFINGCKYCGAVRGPSDSVHGSLGGCEAQHRDRVVLLPQLDGPVRGAAQEHIGIKWRPFNVVHRVLRDSEI